MAGEPRDPTTRGYEGEPPAEGLPTPGGDAASHPHEPGLYQTPSGRTRHMLPVVWLAIAFLVLLFLLFART